MTREQQIEKAVFFAQYWGQKVLNWKGSSDKNVETFEMDEALSLINTSYLSLIHLKDIKGEDALDLCDIIDLIDCNHFIDCLIREDNIYKIGATKSIEAIDFLRSRGYAVAYRGVSVPEQALRGWIKIKGM